MRAGLVRFELPVDTEQLADRLTHYLGELCKWNKAYNLTAVRNPSEMVPRHIYDSLSVLPYITGEYVADVGTGAGLPGIPLALCCPEKHFTLLDSNGKKTRFVQHAVNALGLINVSVEQVRVEDYRPTTAFDTVVSRAFASLHDFVAGCGHTMATGGRLVAMKGRFPTDELGALENAQPLWRLSDSGAVDVPEVEGERHILVLERQGA